MKRAWISDWQVLSIESPRLCLQRVCDTPWPIHTVDTCGKRQGLGYPSRQEGHTLSGTLTAQHPQITPSLQCHSAEFMWFPASHILTFVRERKRCSETQILCRLLRGRQLLTRVTCDHHLNCCAQLSFRKAVFSKKESQYILLNGKQSLGLHGVKDLALSLLHRDNNLGPRQGKKKDKNLKEPSLALF